jgi:hypothetical protein
MRALEVCLNGKRLCVAGVGDDGVISTNVSCVFGQGGEGLFLDTSGINNAARELWRWHFRKIKVGDRIQVAVIETAKAGKPKDRKPEQVGRAEQIRREKQLVRQLTKKFGWKIQTAHPSAGLSEQLRNGR